MSTQGGTCESEFDAAAWAVLCVLRLDMSGMGDFLGPDWKSEFDGMVTSSLDLFRAWYGQQYDVSGTQPATAGMRRVATTVYEHRQKVR